MTNRVVNPTIAADLGVSIPFVSRLRSALKTPGGWTVVKVASVYGWPVDKQRAALDAGSWATEFERVVTEHYAKSGAGAE